jgi:hypothetical protein
MYTIVFSNIGRYVVWVCQNKSVYESELDRLDRLGHCVILQNGVSMYMRQDDSEPNWSSIVSQNISQRAAK